MTRYEAGETLASIARTYDCSPPAISYIVSRSREQSSNEVLAQPAAEPQLVKAQGHGASADGVAENEPAVAPPAPAVEIRREPAAEAAPAMNGDHRRKLHLSLGNGGGNGGQAPTNGNGHADLFAAGGRPPQPSFPPPRPMPQQAAAERTPQHPLQGSPSHRENVAAPLDARPVQQPRDVDAPRKGNGSFIDRELRDRVDDDIAAFLAAFDAALAEDNQASRFGLREATDRLLRAGARTRIELERLEAKLPLPPRDGGARPEQAAWRYR